MLARRFSSTCENRTGPQMLRPGHQLYQLPTSNIPLFTWLGLIHECCQKFFCQSAGAAHGFRRRRMGPCHATEFSVRRGFTQSPPVNIQALFDVLKAAHSKCGHRDDVVIGSLSILGMSEASSIPDGMTMSIGADCYTPADQPRIFELQPLLGEGNAYHGRNGIYLNPVPPTTHAPARLRAHAQHIVL